MLWTLIGQYRTGWSLILENHNCLVILKSFLLESGEDVDDEHCPHQLFTEMDELRTDNDGVSKWKETARWIKFEEDVEEGGERWSKPHVATLSLHSLFELRNCLTKQSVLLDAEATTMEEVANLIVNQLQYSTLTKEQRDQVKKTPNSADD